MTYRKYHNLAGEMNDDMLSRLREILNDKDCVNHVIYFSSKGGSVYITDIMISMIKHYNHHGSGKRCLLVPYGVLFSNGFMICFKLPKTCVKYIGSFNGMIHQVRITVDVSGNGEYPDKEDKARKGFVSSIHNADLKLLKRIGITEVELKAVAKNEDVYLSHERMVELFEKNGIKKFN